VLAAARRSAGVDWAEAPWKQLGTCGVLTQGCTRRCLAQEQALGQGPANTQHVIPSIDGINDDNGMQGSRSTPQQVGSLSAEHASNTCVQRHYTTWYRTCWLVARGWLQGDKFWVGWSAGNTLARCPVPVDVGGPADLFWTCAAAMLLANGVEVGAGRLARQCQQEPAQQCCDLCAVTLWLVTPTSSWCVAQRVQWFVCLYAACSGL
jgi:hypothetical protein